MAIDSKGNKVMDITGQLHGVTISGKEVETLDNLKGDFVDMHNHPNDNLPSSADYNFWLRFQPAEARVVGTDGTHILKPKEGTWFPGARKDGYYADEMVTHYMSPQYYQSHGLDYPGEDKPKILQQNALNVLLKEGWLDYEFVPS